MRDIIFGLDAPPVGVKPYKSGSELDGAVGWHGLMNELGTFADGGREFAFASCTGGGAMALSCADISVLTQAKAANYCGQFIALRHYGRRCGSPPGAVSRLYLAGGFANYLNVDNAAAIGLIAGFPPDRVVKMGNAAPEGATLMLLSQGEGRRRK